MVSTKCVICNARKGKRLCPVERGVICAPCCGKRLYGQGICPQECVYLQAGKGYSMHRKEGLFSRMDDFQRANVIFIAQLERSIYERLQKDAYYTDEDILHGIERKMDVMEHHEKGAEVLLNRAGVVESALDEVIKMVRHDQGSEFTDQRILKVLIAYAKLIKDLAGKKEGSIRYIEGLKDRIAKVDMDALKGEKPPGDSLISLPFSKKV